MDTLTAAERSERMARIRSKDTKPEMRVRKLVYALGYRFRLHRRDLPGSPDLVFPSRRRVVFVHGCFWHGHENCKVANRPKSRTGYWDAKFARNRARDAKNEALLAQGGWQVFTVWECETKGNERLTSRILRFLGPANANTNKRGASDGRR